VSLSLPEAQLVRRIFRHIWQLQTVLFFLRRPTDVLPHIPRRYRFLAIRFALYSLSPIMLSPMVSYSG